MRGSAPNADHLFALIASENGHAHKTVADEELAVWLTFTDGSSGPADDLLELDLEIWTMDRAKLGIPEDCDVDTIPTFERVDVACEASF